eukprot:1449893-Pleurochrysis_carterae.AAC.1
MHSSHLARQPSCARCACFTPHSLASPSTAHSLPKSSRTAAPGSHPTARVQPWSRGVACATRTPPIHQSRQYSPPLPTTPPPSSRWNVSSLHCCL